MINLKDIDERAKKNDFIEIAMYIAEADLLSNPTDGVWAKKEIEKGISLLEPGDGEIYDYDEYPNLGHESFFIGKDMYYFEHLIVDIDTINHIKVSNRDSLETKKIYHLVVGAGELITLIIMISIAYKVIKLTKCKSARVATLVIMINLCIFSHMIYNIFSFGDVYVQI